eukprot:scaffold154186_cov32-Prasinocladus_malaysianus.AAC.1
MRGLYKGTGTPGRHAWLQGPKAQCSSFYIMPLVDGRGSSGVPKWPEAGYVALIAAGRDGGGVPLSPRIGVGFTALLGIYWPGAQLRAVLRWGCMRRGWSCRELR